MKTQWSVIVSGVCAALLTGCPSNENPDVISGTDSATDTGTMDAVDATTAPDASPDVQGTDVQGTDVQGSDVQGADVQGTDVQGTDAVDVPVVDVPIDTGSGTPLNGCTTFTDLTASGATRTITFAGTSYTPNCIRIAPGQSVMFSGSFLAHPLTPGRAPSRPTTDSPSSTPTPITITATGTSSTFAFPTAGDYGFYCSVHESFGMYGVIRVM